MRKIMKIAIGAAMACGAAVAVAAPAAAQVSFGVGVGPAYGYGYPAPVAPVCYDAYGNYLYSYPYCTAYAAPVYGGPVIEPYFGVGIGGFGWGGDRFHGGDFRGGHAFVGGHNFVGRTGGGGHMAFSGGGNRHHG